MGGQTLFQMLIGAFSGSRPQTAEEPKIELPSDFYNPLSFKPGGYVKIGTLDLMQATFSVEQMSELTRRIGSKSLKVMDYSLHDPDTGDGDGTWRTIRCIDKQGGSFDCMILTPVTEMKYSLDAAKVLEGDELVDDETQVTYRKLAENHATFRELSSSGISRGSIVYYDFINEEESEPRFYVVEVDQDSGWIQTYRSAPIDRRDVKAIAGHV